jgi:predicted choloylglycine hydrolase
MMKNERRESTGSLSTVNGVKVLRLYGGPYEIGKQHGTQMAKEIATLVPEALDAAAAVIAKTIKVSYQTAKQLMELGRDAARPYIPERFMAEMQGITVGVNEAGYFINLEDVLLWNSMYDLWCLYAHPQYSHPSDSSAQKGEFSGGKPGSHVLVVAGCSSFSAWGKAVVGDALIHGKNMDNLNLPGILDSRILVIVEPDSGCDHAFITHPGMIGIDGGMNSAGISMMTQYDAFIDETMKGCGIGVHTRLLLTDAGTLDEAVGSLADYPHCTGIAFHVADSNRNSAVIVNASAKQFTLRYPTREMLFTSNHTNCYPGWYGYDGYNMVKDQQKVYTLTDVSTIEAWQTSLRDPKNIWVPAPSRFERYEQLLGEQIGRITPQSAQQILSDRYDPYTGKTRDKWSPSVSNNILATICALYPDDTFYEDDPAKTFKAHVANLWSMVMTPKTGDFWLAIQDFPAQYGGYVHFNLASLIAEKE